MAIINTNPDGITHNNGEMIITWNSSLNTGIQIIDEQHKHLVNLTNELYQACKLGGDVLDAMFKITMSQMVEYVRFHFTFEQNMLQRVKYPKFMEQKVEHDNLIKTVLEATKDYADKKSRFVPNNFVRFLRDWIVGHIGHADKMYAVYILDLMRKGVISEKDITG